MYLCSVSMLGNKIYNIVNTGASNLTMCDNKYRGSVNYVQSVVPTLSVPHCSQCEGIKG